mmetsp:Transcript_60116/g.161258  ORF Transcript_60116/g.161258 Transcript_60116/m.161258 type:complete len:207 (-) Transcript_60116:2007-2627(-)
MVSTKKSRSASALRSKFSSSFLSSWSYATFPVFSSTCACKFANTPRIRCSAICILDFFFSCRSMSRFSSAVFPWATRVWWWSPPPFSKCPPSSSSFLSSMAVIIVAAAWILATPRWWRKLAQARICTARDTPTEIRNAPLRMKIPKARKRFAVAPRSKTRIICMKRMEKVQTSNDRNSVLSRSLLARLSKGSVRRWKTRKTRAMSM